MQIDVETKIFIILRDQDILLDISLFPPYDNSGSIGIYPHPIYSGSLQQLFRRQETFFTSIKNILRYEHSLWSLRHFYLFVCLCVCHAF